MRKWWTTDNARSVRWIGFVLIVTVALATVAGCGGGGGGTPNPPPSGTEQRAGRINISEVGGTGLHIMTPEQDTTPVSNDGRFTTTVSNSRVQLLWAVDSSNQARAIGISLPTSEGSSTTILQVDAESTALAMVLMTPGILAVLPNEVNDRLNEIRSLPSYPALVEVIRTKLRSMTLAELVRDESVQTAMEQCVNEWLGRSARSVANSRSQIQPGPPSARFAVTVRDESNLEAVVLRLENSGWRFVRVQRRELREGRELRVSLVGNMAGMPGVTYGTLFSWTFAEPTTKDDSVNFLESDTVQYWIVGPGISTGIQAPPSISTSDTDVLGITLLYYLVFPILDLLVGIIPNTDTRLAAQILWSRIYLVPVIATAINELSRKNTLREWVRACAEVVSVIIGYIASHVDVLVELGVIIKSAAFLSKLKLAAGIALLTANFLPIAKTLLVLPRVSKVEVTRGGTALGSFTCTLRWDTLGDVDLHLWTPTGEHCYFGNMRVTHGELDVDNVDGYGPENITLENAPPGRYRVAVNYYRGTASPTANVVVTSGSLRVDGGRYRFTIPNRNEGYPITRNTASWWRPFDIVIEPDGRVRVVEPDFAPLNRGRAMSDSTKK